MRTPPYYEEDVGRFFEGKPAEYRLYQALFRPLAERLPEASVKVQKSQISFYGRRLFGCVSLRRRRAWPRPCIVVTVGLSYPLESRRVVEAVEPYPNRWTNHILLTREEEADAELLGWLCEAYGFAQSK